jgi:hypothetical protein
MDSSKEDKKLFGEMLKQINSNFHRCFWPKGSCSNKAIRVHSIQNSDVLDLLCEHDHVIMPKIEIDIDAGPSLKFEKVGRNKATTFTGLCDEHDSQLFEPIDNHQFDPKNNEHLFLFAYRSVLRELYAKMKGAVDIQKQYARGVELGRFNPEVSDQPMMLATIAIAEAYSFYLYKFKFDQIYTNRDYGKIKHRVDFIENIEASIAVSSAYSHIDNMKTLQDRRDPKCISLNVFPCNNGIYIIFSYRKDHDNNIAPHIDRIFQAERFYKLYLVSKLVLMYCENFVMSPKFFRNIPESSKKIIIDYFMDNIMGDKKDSESTSLYLFN